MQTVEKRPPDTSIRIDGEHAKALAAWVTDLNEGASGPWTRAEVIRRVLDHVLLSRDPALLKPVKPTKD